MASKTALQVINDVLTELREDEVTDFSADYTKLLLRYLNRIKTRIEGAHDWDALINSVDFDSIANQREYDLTQNLSGGGHALNTSASLADADTSKLVYRIEDSSTGFSKVRIPLAFDITNKSTGQGYDLKEISRGRDISKREMDSQITISEPVEFAFRRGQFYFQEKPTSARNYRLYLYTPQAEITATTDTISIPPEPLILGISWFAASERGEELGINANELKEAYQVALTDAIIVDSGSEERELYPS